MTENFDRTSWNITGRMVECGTDVSDQPFQAFGKRQVIDIPTIKQVKRT